MLNTSINNTVYNFNYSINDIFIKSVLIKIDNASQYKRICKYECYTERREFINLYKQMSKYI